MPVLPRIVARQTVAPEVPVGLAEDFREAVAVFADSPKASAALSRRCLQGLLREYGKNKKGESISEGNLATEIDQVLPSLPSTLAHAVDAIRNIGNFAAHPLKETATGQVLPVEEGEADWCLDVLEALFDYYFVQPAKLEQKQDALNAKLAAIGKPPLKSS